MTGLSTNYECACQLLTVFRDSHGNVRQALRYPNLAHDAAQQGLLGECFSDALEKANDMGWIEVSENRPLVRLTDAGRDMLDRI